MLLFKQKNYQLKPTTFILTSFALLYTAPFFNQGFTTVFGISLYPFVLLILLFGLLVYLIKINGFNKNDINLIYIASIIGVLVLLSVLISVFKNISNQGKIISLILTFLYLFVIILTDISEKDIALFISSVFIFSIIGLFLDIKDYKLLITGIMTSSRMIYSANPLSIAVLSYSAAICLIEKVSQKKIYLFFLILFILLGLVTLSRGPLLAFLCVILTMTLFKRKYKLLLFFLFLGMIGMLFLFSMRSHSTTGLSNGRIEGYYKFLKLYYDKSTIIFGLGIGFFSDYFGNRAYPHNMIIELLVEIGPLFALFILSFYFYLFIEMFNISKNSYDKKLFTMYYLSMFLFIFTQFSMPGFEALRMLLPLIFLIKKYINIRKELEIM